MKATIKSLFLFLTFLIPVFASACNLPDFNKTSMPESTSPQATATFLVGDLGWGAIHGTVTDSVTGLPIPGATVTCRHSSYTSPSQCNTSTVTEKDGTYKFAEFFFHDTDRVQLEVRADGYVSRSLDVNFLISPWLVADFVLVPAAATEAPQAMCTQPACRPYESLYCPQGNCPNGCGYVCATPAAICTPPICAIGTNEVYFCSEVCPGGCGTTCATLTPVP
jgi:hypothetical protein